MAGKQASGGDERLLGQSGGSAFGSTGGSSTHASLAEQKLRNPALG